VVLERWRPIRPFLRSAVAAVVLCTVAVGIPSLLTGCGDPGEGAPDALARLATSISERDEEIAVYYRDLEGTDSFLVNPDLRMHAASTMKVPVMIQLFQDRDQGLLSLDDSMEVTTTFSSIVDGSPYTLSAEVDGDSTLYELEGEEVSYRRLLDLMITYSSNLATNLLIREADAERVTATMRALGADSIQVLRGVEDGPAFRAGLSNTTTARDLGVILTALAREEVATPESSREMMEIMSRQHWRTKIPAKLPEGVRVAHKTGRITEISHDAGIVYPPEAPPYVVVILTRGFRDGQVADSVAADISRTIYDAHVARH